MPIDKIIETVKANYGEIARRVATGARGSCCGPACCGGDSDPITANLYADHETAGLPEKALLASLGCGNPTALAELRPGEVVLDLGSGGGIDVLLSAKRVGSTGKAYGLDMTDDMLALARQNAERAGATNVEFLKGQIEAVPLPDHSVDVIISNCVVNLSADKRRVIAEAFRVLRPGGRFAVSDVVIRGDMPEAVRQSMSLWTGCVGGALEEREFLRLLDEAGFVEASIDPTRVYSYEDMRTVLAGTGVDADLVARDLAGNVVSAFVRATKPRGPQLRAATSHDLPAIERLLVDAHLPTDGVAPSLPTFVVAEDSGTVVGAAGLELCGNDALLRSVVVAPAWQSRGLGRMLVTRAIGEAEARRLHALYLLTTTAEQYFPAFGFERLSRDDVPADVRATAEFQTACPASATVMRKVL